MELNIFKTHTKVLRKILNDIRLYYIKFKGVGKLFLTYCTYLVNSLNDCRLFGTQLIQPCAAPSSGAQYPPTVLCKAAPSSPFVVNPSPGPLLPLMAFRSNAEAVTIGE